ncbi:aminodeoxychorismate/anthranilate synthase component II [Metasolibacillus meyeri]|uniref:Aminodeoxychorismate/anthranilate synthase component II n=1 Tax=Metasolibacillus meyeri TaxID=1071052 RepID=A0AAW9NU90_9BACL|nr:aminodeoxychorismate/anthranilate synthase component II [Metasolibacillus meyeri]MEC1180036.1 aminodeoxychorismate/anthranilate synthase component II [Metasolibacillus meyeri]
MILLIDNYDSFTYNLYHQIAAFGQKVQVVRNDKITADEIRALQPKAIVISPGPGIPSEAGNVIDIIQSLHQEFPILGICLGHQAIGEAFGAHVVRADRIIHGKMSLLTHRQQGLLQNVAQDEEVMRYHSLVIERHTLSDDFLVTASAADDGEIMAIQHKEYPLYGLQFHPESIGTKAGNAMIEAFLNRVKHP